MQVLEDSGVDPFLTPWRRGFVEDFKVLFGEVNEGNFCTLLVDLSFNVRTLIRVRLTSLAALENFKVGASARKIRKREGRRGQDRVREILPAGTEVRVCPTESESQSRWPCVVCYRTEEGWVSVGDLLLSEGRAEEWWMSKSSGRSRPESLQKSIYPDYFYKVAHFIGDPIFPGEWDYTNKTLCELGLNARTKITDTENTHYPDMEICQDCRKERERRQSESSS